MAANTFPGIVKGSTVDASDKGTVEVTNAEKGATLKLYLAEDKDSYRNLNTLKMMRHLPLLLMSILDSIMSHRQQLLMELKKFQMLHQS